MSDYEGNVGCDLPHGNRGIHLVSCSVVQSGSRNVPGSRFIADERPINVCNRYSVKPAKVQCRTPRSFLKAVIKRLVDVYLCGASDQPEAYRAQFATAFVDAVREGIADPYAYVRARWPEHKLGLMDTSILFNVFSVTYAAFDK